jgi:hypothetical protein
MSSQFRTALAAAGVLTICVSLSMMKGHHLLMTFALGGLACGLWSWLEYARKMASRKAIQNDLSEEDYYTTRARMPVAEANVYQFPAQWQMSDASGS